MTLYTWFISSKVSLIKKKEKLFNIEVSQNVHCIFCVSICSYKSLKKCLKFFYLKNCSYRSPIGRAQLIYQYEQTKKERYINCVKEKLQEDGRLSFFSRPHILLLGVIPAVVEFTGILGFVGFRRSQELLFQESLILGVPRLVNIIGSNICFCICKSRNRPFSSCHL